MGVYLVESWWLSGVVSSLVAAATSSKANPPCRRQRRGPLVLRGMYIYIYIYLYIHISPCARLQFLVPLFHVATMPPDFAVSFQQLDKTSQLLRLIPKKYYHETDERRENSASSRSLMLGRNENNGVFQEMERVESLTIGFVLW